MAPAGALAVRAAPPLFFMSATTALPAAAAATSALPKHLTDAVVALARARARAAAALTNVNALHAKALRKRTTLHPPIQESSRMSVLNLI